MSIFKKRLKDASGNIIYPQTTTECVYDTDNNRLDTLLQNARIPIGTIVPFGGSTVPSGWLECNGAAINRTDYAQLFSIIGIIYGSGDGSTTFNLPDLQGKVVAGVSGTDSDFDLGDSGGEKTVKLELANYRYRIWRPTEESGDDINTTFSGISGGYGINTKYKSGNNNTAHNNLQPYLTTKYIIKANNNSISEPVSPTIEQRIGAIETQKVPFSFGKSDSTYGYYKDGESSLTPFFADIYTTSERQIGTWIDGSMLYRRVYQCTIPSSSGWSNIQYFTAGTVVRLWGIFTGSDGRIMHTNWCDNGSGGSTQYNVVLSKNGNYIQVGRGSSGSWGGRTIYVIVDYTK